MVQDKMKIGDKVSVIDEDLSGTVTSVHGKKVVFIDEHGFTHQFPTEKLVVQNLELYDGINIQHKKETSKPVSKKHSKNLQILDLHFEKLVENPADYDSFERLFIQKEKLLEKLDYCRENNLKKLEIIHGVGDGTLQRMVFDVLESTTGIEFHNKEILHHQSSAVLVYFK